MIFVKCLYYKKGLRTSVFTKANFLKTHLNIYVNKSRNRCIQYYVGIDSYKMIR